MKLCMFHPLDHPLKRGWVGRVDGEHVVQLAAQTLQSFFTGGGSAREHAVYPLDKVRLLAPVLHPPAVRIFDDESSFSFANPAAIVGPEASVPRDTVSRDGLRLLPRIAAVVGAGDLAGYTLFAEWRRPGVEPPKDRDFALALGPVVVTPAELASERLGVVVRVNGTKGLDVAFEGFDWTAARELAADGTILCPGDILAGPALAEVHVEPGESVEVETDRIGVLAQRVAR